MIGFGDVESKLEGGASAHTDAPNSGKHWHEKVKDTPPASTGSQAAVWITAFLPYLSLAAFSKPAKDWDPATIVDVTFGASLVLWIGFIFYIAGGISYFPTKLGLTKEDVRNWNESLSWMFGPFLAITVPTFGLYVIAVLLLDDKKQDMEGIILSLLCHIQ